MENKNTKGTLLEAEKRSKILGGIGKGLIYVMLSFWALVVLFPFYYMILTSVKNFGAYNAEMMPKLFTTAPTFENYKVVFDMDPPMSRYLLNTLIYTVATTAIMLVVSILAAFAFARLNFKGKNLAFTLLLSLMMIPSELVIITNFVTVKQHLGLANTFMGLILPSVASIFYIYLLKENFAQIPDEIYLASKVDGTNDLKFLFKVVVPICKPTIITVIILKAIECWNSYIWPNLITDDKNYYLVSSGIQTIRESGFGRENIPAMMAAVTTISAPLIVLFIIFRKMIMEGVSRGGTKG